MFSTIVGSALLFTLQRCVCVFDRYSTLLKSYICEQQQVDFCVRTGPMKIRNSDLKYYRVVDEGEDRGEYNLTDRLSPDRIL